MRLYTGATAYRHGQLEALSVVEDHGRFVSIGGDVDRTACDCVMDLTGYLLIPGFADVHVHLREPGFFHKETMRTGTRAAARGGYTQLCAMPNVQPPPDGMDGLSCTLRAIAQGAAVRVYPYGALTVGRKGRGSLAALDEMMPYVVGFSDDGTGVQDEGLMRAAMRSVKALGGIIAAHCEDESLIGGGYIHDGEYAAAHGHRGISSMSEWAQLERDLRLAGETGCRYHVCHVSTKESVQLIRAAKAQGVDVTCETAPHYLVLTDADLREDGRFKMNPPIRGAADREALVQGLIDGTVDMIATDHAPHTAEEKGRGLRDSLMGVVGLETAFASLYTHLVLPGAVALERLLFAMCDAPRARFSLPGGLEVGQAADFALLDLNARGVVDPRTFLSMGRATPFAGMPLQGACVLTVVDGKIIYKEDGLDLSH